MKAFFLVICSVVSALYSASQEDVNAFLQTFPGTSYQDLLVDGRCVQKGTDICQVRYEMITPILDLYQRPFSVLDLGAAQGYFSFKIAHNYPQSTCVMIGANCDYYANHGDMLHDLCCLNSRLNNIFYLNKFVGISDLNFLNQNEHFDVVLALLVIHMIDETLVRRIAVIESLLTLGDHVIIEVSNDVAPDLWQFVGNLSKKLDCIYLGEVRRHYNLESKSTGKLFCFRNVRPEGVELNQCMGVSKETFSRLNGVYP